MISFTQNLISVNKYEASICWIVENNSNNVISDAVAFSNNFNYNFGCIGIGDIKTVSFKTPVDHIAMLDCATMNYLIGDDVCFVKSNILCNL